MPHQDESSTKPTALQRVRSGGGSWLFPVTLYLGITLALLWGPLRSGGRVVIGHPESDVWKHLWGAWWMKENLLQGSFPYFTRLQNFPEGGRLYVIDPLNTLLSTPLQLIWGLPQAYNLVMAFQLMAAACGAFLLARRLTGDPRAALVAGAAYGFSPFILTSGLSSGIAETANLGWLPLALLGLVGCLNSDRQANGWGSLLTSSLGLALAALGSWYYGITAGLMGLLLGLWTLATGRPPTPDPPARPGWGRAAASCLLAGVLVLPFALLFLGSLEGEGSLLARIDVSSRLDESSLEFLHRQGNFKNDADLSGYLLPGKARLSVADDVDRRMKSHYGGLLVWALAAWGWWRGGDWTRFWGLAGLVMIALSIGPFAYLAPGLGLADPRNPFYMLGYYAIPGFRFIAIADRLSTGAQLCLAVLAAAGLTRLLPEGRRGTLVGVALCGALLLETAWISPVPWPLPTSSAQLPASIQALGDSPPGLALLELPLNRVGQTLQPGEYYYWQTHHRRPLPITLTTRFPTGMMENSLAGTLYLCETEGYGSPPPASELGAGLMALEQAGFGAILVHPRLMSPTAAGKVRATLDQILHPPREFPDGDLLYTLPGAAP